MRIILIMRPLFTMLIIAMLKTLLYTMLPNPCPPRPCLLPPIKENAITILTCLNDSRLKAAAMLDSLDFKVLFDIKYDIHSSYTQPR